MMKEVFIFPTSFAQQRLWFLDQMSPGDLAYNMPCSVLLRGQLSAKILERSLNEVVRRHEALRTTFAVVDGTPVQVIIPALTLELPVTDLRQLPEGERKAQARHLADQEAQQSFDLIEGPLIRTRLLRLSEREQLLLLTIHHIVCDGWSLGVLVKELAALYKAFSAAKKSPLEELPI
ncbi:MAG TPA: condensation domain-containing protein, partial [Pyrinomonadaceae bacterium]|nr:condensation domain-containing protein [Pyrinomonadaceae bacterium]